VLPQLSHPRLHLAETDSLADRVESVAPRGAGLDEDVLSGYSMERYTDEMLDALAAAVDADA
jgi:hypothetical protein